VDAARVQLRPGGQRSGARPSRILSSPRPIDDDRADIKQGDRVLLIVEDDITFARIMLQMAHDKGFKVIVAARGDVGLTLANKYRPDAITLDIKLPGLDGWTLLDRLKRSPTTRHIPVHVISIDEMSRRGAALGAFAYLEKPVSREALEGAFEHMTTFLDRSVRRLLLVEDDDTQRDSIVELVGEGEDVQVTAVRSAEEALAALDSGQFDCMVVDLVLPGDDGIQLIERVRARAKTRAARAADHRLHRQGPDAGGRGRAEEIRAVGDPEEHGALARASAQRDGAVPPPHREPPARTIQGGAGGQPAQRSFGRGAQGAGRRRRRPQHLRDDQRPRGQRPRGHLRRKRPGGHRGADPRPRRSMSC
jgi:CheY-like chemotaxis protein